MTGVAMLLHTCTGVWMRLYREPNSFVSSGTSNLFFIYQIYPKCPYHDLFIDISLSFVGLGLRARADCWVGSHQR